MFPLVRRSCFFSGPLTWKARDALSLFDLLPPLPPPEGLNRPSPNSNLIHFSPRRVLANARSPSLNEYVGKYLPGAFFPPPPPPGLQIFFYYCRAKACPPNLVVQLLHFLLFRSPLHPLPLPTICFSFFLSRLETLYLPSWSSINHYSAFSAPLVSAPPPSVRVVNEVAFSIGRSLFLLSFPSLHTSSDPAQASPIRVPPFPLNTLRTPCRILLLLTFFFFLFFPI